LETRGASDIAVFDATTQFSFFIVTVSTPASRLSLYRDFGLFWTSPSNYGSTLQYSLNRIVGPMAHIAFCKFCPIEIN